MGMMLYVDAFAGNLVGVMEKLLNLEDVIITKVENISDARCKLRI